eukprot:scaffold50096_cov63-Phaeocystis_antarctica.AAC.1
MWETRWLRTRPAGSPEASLCARARLRLPQAPASLGQSATLQPLGPRWPCFPHRPTLPIASSRLRAPTTPPQSSWAPSACCSRESRLCAALKRIGSRSQTRIALK